MRQNRIPPLKAGIIGRVSESKGLAEIEAFADYLEKSQVSNVELHVIGDADPGDEKLAQLFRKFREYRYAKVILRGFIDNKSEMMYYYS